MAQILLDKHRMEQGGDQEKAQSSNYQRSIDTFNWQQGTHKKDDQQGSHQSGIGRLITTTSTIKRSYCTGTGQGEQD